MKEELERKKVIVINGDDFTLDITNLKVGDYIALETEKQRLSGSKYYELATTYFTNTLNAASLIDMIATFRVLLPDIEKSISAESFEKLNIIDTKELLKVYIKEVAPWYQSWMKEFNSPFEDENVDDGLNDEK